MSRPLYDVDDCAGGDDDVEEEGAIDEGKDFDDGDDEDDIVVMDNAMFAGCSWQDWVGRSWGIVRRWDCIAIQSYPFHCIMLFHFVWLARLPR
jgi:hypothetical protein